MCSVMNELKRIEDQARKDCHGGAEYEIQALYGQLCLEAQRMQRNHWASCETCQSASYPEATP